ncbi:hypothetical protein [Azotobacter beijerinckii]|uniref:hypothetical protein n=1 Tax=Azotobacter beijerinckii TaxID=170623 RepID=UPI0011603A53|nr:hypothetical protein [Azotobacter beijerinckii]
MRDLGRELFLADPFQRRFRQIKAVTPMARAWFAEEISVGRTLGQQGRPNQPQFRRGPGALVCSCFQLLHDVEQPESQVITAATDRKLDCLPDQGRGTSQGVGSGCRRLVGW